MIDGLKPEGNTQYEIAEPGGLRIVVGRRSKAWAVRYLSPTTKRHRKLTLGSYPEMGLADARTALGRVREQLALGVDPAEIKLGEQRQRLEAPTVDEVIDEYLLRRASKKKSGDGDRRYLKVEVSPRLGSMKIFSVRRADVLALVDDKMDTGAEVGAAHLLGFVRMLFDFALERGYVEANPAAGIKPPAKANRRDRILADKEIKRLWQSLEGFDRAPAVAAILKLCLATGQRVSEVRLLRWEQIDGDWWTIPATTAKNKLAHGVFLSPLAKGIISGLGSPGRGFVFPGKSADKPLDRNTPDRHWRRHREEISLTGVNIHDLRRTVATRMTEIGINRLVVSKVLNHAERGVTSIYDRYEYRPEIEAALVKWGEALTGIITATPAAAEAPAEGQAEPNAPTPAQLVEAILREVEAAHRDPDQTADYLRGLEACLAFGHPVPTWLARKVVLAIGDYRLKAYPSINDALGSPTWRGKDKRRDTITKFKILAWTDYLVGLFGGSDSSHDQTIQKWLQDDGVFLDAVTIGKYRSAARKAQK